jgi:hypothetical protein
VERLDFELEISPGPPDHFVVTARSEFGEVSSPFSLRLDPWQVHERANALQRHLLVGPGVSGTSTEDHELARRFGRELFDAALPPGPVRERFEAARDAALLRGVDLRVILRTGAPGLAALPWDLMFSDDPRTVGDRRMPVVRYAAHEVADHPPRLPNRIRILGLTPFPPSQSAGVMDVERDWLARALRESSASGRVELRWLTNGTWQEVQTALLEGPWHVIHFFGHGGFDEERGEGFLYVRDETGETTRLAAKALGRLVGDQRALRLVILKSSVGVADGSLDVFASTAATLLDRGCPSVVTLPLRIPDGAAAEFDRSVYSAIAEGEPIDSALAAAMASMARAAPSGFAWVAPTLFTRVYTGAVFEVSKPRTEKAPPKREASRPPDRKAQPPGAAQRTGPPPSAPSASVSAPADIKVQKGHPGLVDGLSHGGYIPTWFGAVLGAVAALALMQTIDLAGVVDTVAKTFWPTFNRTDIVDLVHRQGIHLGVWIATVAGAKLALDLFQVSDRRWTVFLLGLLAIFLVGSAPGLDNARLLDVNQVGPPLVLGVVAIVFVARATTRLGRQHRI